MTIRYNLTNNTVTQKYILELFYYYTLSEQLQIPIDTVLRNNLYISYCFRQRAFGVVVYL